MAQQLAGVGAAISGSSTANVSDNESLAKAETEEGLPLFTPPQPAQSQRNTLKRFPSLEFTLYLSRVEKDKPAVHVLRGLQELRAQLSAPCCCTLDKRYPGSNAEESLGAEPQQRKQRLVVDSVSAISVVVTEISLGGAVVCWDWFSPVRAEKGSC